MNDRQIIEEMKCMYCNSPTISITKEYNLEGNIYCLVYKCDSCGKVQSFETEYKSTWIGGEKE